MLGQTTGLVWIALSTGGSYPALIPGMVLTGVGVFAAAGSFASPAAVSHGVRMALLVTAAISASGALAGVGLRATRVAGLPASAPRVTAETATPRR
jgi:hypothetical protein